MQRPFIYHTQTRDAISHLLVTVIDSTTMPLDRKLPDLEAEIPFLLKDFPCNDLVLVVFASQAPRAPQVHWLRKVHAKLSRDFKKSILKVYVVHARWYTRAFNRALAPIVSQKFASKIKFVRDLTELSHYMDITTLDINPAVYRDDLSRFDSNKDGVISVPKQSNSIFEMPLPQSRSSFWRAAFVYLNKCHIDEQVFVPLSRMTETETELTQVLVNAISREQRLRLCDYGPVVVLATIKEYLLCLPKPLVVFDEIELPLRITVEYASSVISRLDNSKILHLDDIMSFSRALDHVDQTLIAKSLGPAIMKLRNPRKEEMAIASRLFKLLGNHWEDLVSDDDKDFASSMLERPERKPLSPLLHDKLPQPSPASTKPQIFQNHTLPRNMPSETQSFETCKVRVPNRKAYGKVAEIMKLYEGNQLI